MLGVLEDAEAQSEALKRAAELFSERVDVTAILIDAGVDLAGIEELSLEIDVDLDVDSDAGVLKRCHKVCVGVGKVKVCYTTCG